MLMTLETGVRGGHWYALMDKVWALRTLEAAFRTVVRSAPAVAKSWPSFDQATDQTASVCPSILPFSVPAFQSHSLASLSMPEVANVHGFTTGDQRWLVPAGWGYNSAIEEGEEDVDESELPSGDELASEIERFLRDQS
mgnify:CR=1 FL=1